MIDEKLKEFSQKYNATVNRSHRMHHRVRRVDFKMWSKSDPAIFNTLPYDDVACVEIHMPEDRFRALVEHDNWLQGRYAGIGHRGTGVMEIVEQHERECRARHENSAVQDAYEKYQMLLRLCGG